MRKVAIFCTLSLALMFAGSTAMADARLEIGPNGYDNKGDNFIHFPWDPAETDNELYSSSPLEATFNQYDAGARGNGYGSALMQRNAAILPRALMDLGEYFRDSIYTVTSADAGEVCTMEANGTTYVADNWVVKFSWHSWDKVKAEIACIGGVAK